MVDIHSHILYGVDDGAKTILESISMIKKEIENGISDIILTPHKRHHMFNTSYESIVEHFNALQDELYRQNIDVNLYLGREIFIHNFNEYKRYLTEDKLYSLNESKYILLEFDYVNQLDISEIVYDLKIKGYKPIIAHIERYNYVDVDIVKEIISNGGLIEICASSLTSNSPFKYRKRAKKYLKNDFVSFISSDAHFNRPNDYKKAYKMVLKKYGMSKANQIFELNPSKIIKK